MLNIIISPKYSCTQILNKKKKTIIPTWHPVLHFYEFFQGSGNFSSLSIKRNRRYEKHGTERSKREEKW